MTWSWTVGVVFMAAVLLVETISCFSHWGRATAKALMASATAPRDVATIPGNREARLQATATPQLDRMVAIHERICPLILSRKDDDDFLTPQEKTDAVEFTRKVEE